MRLMIVEDSPFDREALAELLRRDCERHGESADLSFYESGEEFLARYRPKSCDGLFLYVLLGGLTGIEVARRVRERLTEPRTLSLLEPSARGHSAPVEVDLDEILYGQYLDHVMSVVTSSGVYRTRSSFQDFTAQLPHTGRFAVCGRGLVVNLSWVARVLEEELLLKNGDRLSFSRSRRREIQEAFAQWAVARARKGGWGR